MGSPGALARVWRRFRDGSARRGVGKGAYGASECPTRQTRPRPWASTNLERALALSGYRQRELTLWVGSGRGLWLSGIGQQQMTGSAEGFRYDLLLAAEGRVDLRSGTGGLCQAGREAGWGDEDKGWPVSLPILAGPVRSRGPGQTGDLLPGRIARSPDSATRFNNRGSCNVVMREVIASPMLFPQI